MKEFISDDRWIGVALRTSSMYLASGVNPPYRTDVKGDIEFEILLEGFSAVEGRLTGWSRNKDEGI